MSTIQLKDSNKQNLYPVTKSENVKFTDGKNLDEKLANIKTTVTWDDVENKPARFTPDTHTHTEYANAQHTHNYADKDHSHIDYSKTNHTHSDYANKEHIHAEYAMYGHNHNGEYSPVDHGHSASSITSGTISKDRLPVAFGDRVQIGICYLDDDPTNSWHTYEAVGAHASAVRKVYDKVVTAQSTADSAVTKANTAQTKADSAYNLANHSHPYLSSSSLSSSTSSTSTTTPANSYAVKLAYDKANHTHPYASSSHVHNYADLSGDSIKSKAGNLHLYPYSTTWGQIVVDGNGYLRPAGSGNYSLGSSSYRYHGAYFVNSPSVSSDKNLKENINYLNTKRDADSITEVDFYNFIKNDLRLTTYNYKSLRSEEKYENIGFIAQDVKATKIGDILIQEDEEGILSYNTGSYTNVIAGALQKEIEIRENEIESLKKQLELAQNKIIAVEIDMNKRISDLENLLK